MRLDGVSVERREMNAVRSRGLSGCHNRVNLALQMRYRAAQPLVQLLRQEPLLQLLHRGPQLRRVHSAPDLLGQNVLRGRSGRPETHSG